ncbi:hypothetical protein ONE63_003513 [Megalurothrips usitatus]|uniref:HTH CENPB-type domain-containing protein n=1 Tax=Megalurothrips usitatus TaxID=439358 RepID=A0AAV7X386_9NEOP|nr:hypothetical protein ONE63_003513 [Megalurothrips usitatus]
MKGIKRPGKRSTIDLGAKLLILSEVDKAPPGDTRAAIASRLNIPVTTLQGILKTRDKIESAALAGDKKQKKIKKSPFDDVERALVQWIHQARSLPVKPALSGSTLKAQAKIIASRLGVENFTATNGWLTRFRRRNKISYVKLSGESADVNNDTVEAWTQTVLPAHLKGYALKDIFNADEFAVFINLLPDKSMVAPGEDTHGGKQSKARVTCLIGSNADGSEKLTPLIIGKSKKPRCFANIRTLPCTYANQRNAWMDSAIFETWLRKLDGKMRVEKRKILLFIDNCPAHPVVNGLTNIKLIFLPKNTTSKLQPMDQGIIKNIKHYYRTRLVHRLINFIGRPNVQKKDCYINLFQAMHFLQWSWSQVTQETISNCFRRAGFREVRAEEVLPAVPPPRAPQPRRRRPDRDDSSVDGDLEEVSAAESASDTDGEDGNGEGEGPAVDSQEAEGNTPAVDCSEDIPIDETIQEM